jgi:hypothetical protein
VVEEASRDVYCKDLLAYVPSTKYFRTQFLHMLPAGLQPDMVPIHIGGEIKDWPVLLPHKVFAAMAANNRLQQDLIGSLNLQEFWASVASAPWARSALSGVPESDYDKLIPLKLYGDDGEVFKEVSYTFLAWSGINHCTDIFASRQLVAVVPKSDHMWDDKHNLTLRDLVRVIGESLKLMRTGLNEDGTMLARGFRAAYVAYTGDMKHVQEVFNFEGNFNRKKVCWYCTASKYDYVSVDKEWQTAPPSPHAGLIEGWVVESIRIDMLHCLYLGVAEDLLGSIINDAGDLEGWYKPMKKWLLAKGLQLRTRRNRMQQVLDRGPRDYPHFNPLKAACAKFMLLFFGEHLHLISNPTLRAATNCMASFIRSLDDAPLVMPTQTQATARDHGMGFVRLWYSKATSCAATHVLDFKVRPKHHGFHELLKHMTPDDPINPRAWACFGSEDFVGKMCIITLSCHPSTCKSTVLAKWAMHRLVSWTRDRMCNAQCAKIMVSEAPMPLEF